LDDKQYYDVEIYTRDSMQDTHWSFYMKYSTSARESSVGRKGKCRCTGL